MVLIPKTTKIGIPSIKKTRLDEHREMADNAISDLTGMVDRCDRNIIDNTLSAAFSISMYDSDMSYRELFDYKRQLVDITNKHIEKCRRV